MTGSARLAELGTATTRSIYFSLSGKRGKELTTGKENRRARWVGKTGVGERGTTLRGAGAGAPGESIGRWLVCVG